MSLRMASGISRAWISIRPVVNRADRQGIGAEAGRRPAERGHAGENMLLYTQG